MSVLVENEPDLTWVYISGSNGAQFPDTDALMKAASVILRKSVTPTHYRTLAEQASRLLDWSPRNGDEVTQAAERIRQTVAERKARGLCVMTKRNGPKHSVGLVFRLDWFPTYRSLFSNTGDVVANKIDIETVTASIVNALQRSPHMIDKLGASPEALISRRSRGYVVEGHVSKWFKLNYPEFWLPATNDGDPTRGSVDDFRLRIGSTYKTMDVKSPRDNRGTREAIWGPSTDQKCKADFYLLADAIEDGCYLLGYADAEKFAAGVTFETMNSNARLLARLNCLRYRIDYGALAKVAERMNQ